MTDARRRHLRPVERVVLRHLDDGLSSTEIAWRLRRTPRWVDQLVELSGVPGRDASTTAPPAGHLRPLERRIIRSRQSGLDYSEIAARMRRSPGFVARVEEYASYRSRTAGAGG